MAATEEAMVEATVEATVEAMVEATEGFTTLMVHMEADMVHMGEVMGMN